MQASLNQFAAADAALIAISVDSVEQNRKLATDLKLTFPLLSDPELKTIDAYGVRHRGGNNGRDIARPATFIIDREGIIRWRNLAENVRLRPRPEQILQELARIP